MMIRSTFLALALVLAPAAAVADNWPGWRGPNYNGVSAEKGLPVRWSASENVRWKAPLPGAGVSNPIVWGERVFVTASDGRLNDRLHLLCLHRDDGRQLWHARFFGSAQPEGQFAPGGMAVPTPATDGKHVFALFGTGDLVCLDMEGQPVWVRSLAQEYGPFRNRWGMASSPVLLGDLLVVQVDHFGQSYLLGVDAATGADRWRTVRDATVGWSSPLPVKVGKSTQLIATGTHTVRGYAAESGSELWSVRGMVMQCIPTPVAEGDQLIALGGRDSTMLAIRLGAARGDVTDTHIAWKARASGAGIPSPLVLDGLCYYVEDNGFGNCVDVKTGERVWRERLGGRKYSASPVAADGKVYFTSEDGRVTVVQVGRKYKALGRGDVGELVVASPALSQGRVFLRGDKHLYCIGEK